jgi:hypothetical protein
MLTKLTPVVNFINILQAGFVPIFLLQKISNQTVTREKLPKTPSYEKVTSKTRWWNWHQANYLRMDTETLVTSLSLFDLFHVNEEEIKMVGIKIHPFAFPSLLLLPF